MQFWKAFSLSQLWHFCVEKCVIAVVWPQPSAQLPQREHNFPCRTSRTCWNLLSLLALFSHWKVSDTNSWIFFTDFEKEKSQSNKQSLTILMYFTTTSLSYGGRCVCWCLIPTIGHVILRAQMVNEAFSYLIVLLAPVFVLKFTNLRNAIYLLHHAMIYLYCHHSHKHCISKAMNKFIFACIIHLPFLFLTFCDSILWNTST